MASEENFIFALFRTKYIVNSIENIQHKVEDKNKIKGKRKKKLESVGIGLNWTLIQMLHCYIMYNFIHCIQHGNDAGVWTVEFY